MVQDMQKVPKNPGCPKGTERSKVSKRYLIVQGNKGYLKVKGIQKVPKGPRYPKGTKRSKVSKRYLKVQGWQRVPSGPGFNTE